MLVKRSPPLVPASCPKPLRTANMATSIAHALLAYEDYLDIWDIVHVDKDNVRDRLQMFANIAQVQIVLSTVTAIGKLDQRTFSLEDDVISPDEMVVGAEVRLIRYTTNVFELLVPCAVEPLVDINIPKTSLNLLLEVSQALPQNPEAIVDNKALVALEGVIGKEKRPRIEELAAELESKTNTRPRFILTGVTGAGKSSLINAIIGYPLLPFRGEQRSTTAFSTEVVDSKSLGYEAHIEFISRRDFLDAINRYCELDAVIGGQEDSDEDQSIEHKSLFNYLNEVLGSTVEKLLQKSLGEKDYFASYDELLQFDPEIKGALEPVFAVLVAQRETIEDTDIFGLCKKLDTYLLPEATKFLLCKSLVIKGSFPSLFGSSIVDLPGLADQNVLRSTYTKDYIEKTDGKVCYPIIVRKGKVIDDPSFLVDVLEALHARGLLNRSVFVQTGCSELLAFERRALFSDAADGGSLAELLSDSEDLSESFFSAIVKAAKKGSSYKDSVSDLRKRPLILADSKKYLECVNTLQKEICGIPSLLRFIQDTVAREQQSLIRNVSNFFANEIMAPLFPTRIGGLLVSVDLSQKINSIITSNLSALSQPIGLDLLKDFARKQTARDRSVAKNLMVGYMTIHHMVSDRVLSNSLSDHSAPDRKYNGFAIIADLAGAYMKSAVPLFIDHIQLESSNFRKAMKSKMRHFLSDLQSKVLNAAGLDKNIKFPPYDFGQEKRLLEKFESAVQAHLQKLLADVLQRVKQATRASNTAAHNLRNTGKGIFFLPFVLRSHTDVHN